MSKPFSITFPDRMFEEIEARRAARDQTRSEILRDAWRAYRRTLLPVDTASAEENAAFARGRSEYESGDYIPLDQLKRELGAADE